MAIKLSLCIPTYKRSNFIGQTLDAIAEQVTDEVEVVVSDNASPDNTREIVESYHERIANLVYVRSEENLGADRNYLQSVAHANGEYCWLFGDDDIMCPNAIERLLTEFESGCDAYVCAINLCDSKMNILEEHKILLSDKPVEASFSNKREREHYFTLAQSTTALFSFLGSNIVKREIWNDAETPLEFIGTLWVHVAKILNMQNSELKVKWLPGPFLDKRGDNDSFMDVGQVKRYAVAVDGYMKIAEKYFSENSFETRHIKRWLRYEISIIKLLNAKLAAFQAQKNDEIEELDRLCRIMYNNEGIKAQLSFLLYQCTPMQLYLLMKNIKKAVR